MADGAWLKSYLREKNLTTARAAQQCGVSIETMQIVLSGRPTLPCLALQIGSGLGLTQEDVKTLGKPLDANAWGKNGLPQANEIDIDPEWWKHLKKAARKTKTATDVYLDIGLVMQRLIDLDSDTGILRPVLGDYTLNGLNSLRVEMRRKWIEKLEKELHLKEGALSTHRRPKGVHVICFKCDIEKIARLMKRPGYHAESLAMRLYPTRTGLETLQDTLWQIERGDTFSLNKAERWAEALGVKLNEIGEKCIKVY